MIRKLLLALAFIGLLSPAQAQNYNATAGSGLTFGAKSVGSGPAVLYPYTLLCDATTVTQCLAIDPLGRLTVLAVQSGTWNITNISGTISLPTGAATSANQTNKSAFTQLTDGTNGTGSFTAYGTAPTGNWPGVNAFVTNSNANGQATSANSSPVVVASDQSAIKTTSAVNQTPTNCSGSITSGGTAQNAFTAQTTLHGFTIANIDTGHNDEVLWISFTTTAAAGSSASYPLPAPTATTYAGFGSFTSPAGFGTNVALSVIGATTGHVFSCTWW